MFKVHIEKKTGFTLPHKICHFLKLSLLFRKQNDNFSQRLLTKIFMSSNKSKSPLQNPIFGFCIALILVEISYFLFHTTPISGFQITTFKYFRQQLRKASGILF